jgi:dienelactone hydrolase
MMIRSMAVVILFVSSQSPAHAQRSGPNLIQPQIVKVPIKGAGAFGGDVEMITHLYRPQGEGPLPVVAFSHGRGDRQARQNLKNPVLLGHANFWLRMGFAVIAPVRPGYGDTGGLDREDPGHTWRGGSCRGNPDFANTAKVAGAAVLTLLDWMRSQAWANSDRILLVGQSVGGLTTVGLGAKNPPGVVGYINFAGGSGGSPKESPGRSCMPERIIELFREFGKTTRVPSLWLYAENDLYWGPDAPKEWHQVFSAGGSKTQFVMTPPVPGTEDGHELLRAGAKLWAPHVNAFVKEVGF